MVVFWILAEDKEGPQGKGGETCEPCHMAWLGSSGDRAVWCPPADNPQAATLLETQAPGREGGTTVWRGVKGFRWGGVAEARGFSAGVRGSVSLVVWGSQTA